MRHLMLLLVAATGCARWTKADTALELAFVAEQAVDYRQTSEAVTYGAEANPVIGRFGENVSPQAYFLTTTLLHAFVSAALPRYWREAWQGATIVSGAYNDYANAAALHEGVVSRCAQRVGTANQCVF